MTTNTRGENFREVLGSSLTRKEHDQRKYWFGMLLIVVVSRIAEIKMKGSTIIFSCTIITLHFIVIVNNLFVLIPHITGF